MFQTDPYRASWRFVRFDDPEIFDADDAEFDRQAKEAAQAGFTHVMTFSDTHFRWSFRRDWPLLTEGLRRQTEAFHRYGIRVVEHHSANLMWNYENEEQRAEALRHADRKRWPHFEEDMDSDSLFKGVRLGSMYQVSGLTGKPFISFMNSYIMCHNNPDYRRLYFDYLDSLYDTGIDGIMTDDIQFVSGMHPVGPDRVPYFDMDSCACPACREKFRRLTGYELPGPGEEWRRFQADQYAPRFIAWKRFRYESSLDFHQEVVRRYESRGLKLIRPNYTATSVAWVSPWAFVFDEVPRLDWGFVEHCCGILRYSWPEYVFESIHCNMITRQRRIPALALYYPRTADAQELGWALSLYTGQRYLGDPTRRELFQAQKEFHRFEEAHFDALFKVDSCARIAFYDTQMGRELDPDYNTTVRARFNSWAQACTHGNLPWAMVNAGCPEEFGRFSVIVVPGTRFLADSEIRALAEFARNGGVRVWGDEAGCRDSVSAEPRSAEALDALLAPAGERVVRVTARQLTGRYTKRCRVRDEADRDAFDCSEPTRWRGLDPAEQREHQAIVDFLAAQLPDGRDLTLTPAVNDLLVSLYTAPASGIWSLRVANAAGTLDSPAEPGFGEHDPIPFPALPEPLTLRIRRPDGAVWRHATLSLPDAPPEELALTHDGAFTTLVLPGKRIRHFALIELK